MNGNECAVYTLMAADYLDGTLSEKDRAAYEAHIAHCRTCADQLEELKKLNEAIRSSAFTAPAELKAGVMSRIRTNEAARASSRRTFIRRMASIAAAVILIVGISTILPKLISDNVENSKDYAAPDADYIVTENNTAKGAAAPGEMMTGNPEKSEEHKNEDLSEAAQNGNDAYFAENKNIQESAGAVFDRSDAENEGPDSVSPEYGTGAPAEENDGTDESVQIPSDDDDIGPGAAAMYYGFAAALLGTN